MAIEVSVIIPCLNEEKHIRGCLRSIFEFEFEGEFEVIVADGMSTDGTRSILAELMKVHPQLKLIDNPARVPPAALNAAIMASQGDIIVRLDAHADYPTNYLRLCVETSHRTGAQNVGGLFNTMPMEDTVQAHLVRAVTTSRMGVGNSAFRIGAKDGPADTVPFGCFPRTLFEEIGYFDERLLRHEDYEFNQRIIKAGGKVWLNPEIKLNYYGRAHLQGLYVQGYSSAKWDVWSWYLAPYCFSSRHLVPLLFLLSLIGCILLAIFSKAGIVLLGVIMIPYILLAIISAMKAAKLVKSGMWILLPFCFFGFHIAFGLGGLWGSVLMLLNLSPVQKIREPWPGAGQYRPWPPVKSSGRNA